MYLDLKLNEHTPDKSSVWKDHALITTQYFIPEFAMRIASKYDRDADLTLELAEAEIDFSLKALVKILEELLDNAFKFSPPGTPVRVSTQSVNRQFRLMITDQGRGMNAEQIKQINAFIQFDRETYEQQGLGLGLAIASRLAELQQGTLTIDSIPQKGTSVTFTCMLHS